MYSPESSVRKTGSYIYEEFMPTDGTDVKVEFAGSGSFESLTSSCFCSLVSTVVLRRKPSYSWCG